MKIMKFSLCLLVLLLATSAMAQTSTPQRNLADFAAVLGTPSTLSGSYYIPGGRVWSITDRLMIGTAALGNGKNTVSYSGLPAWVAASYLLRDSQLGSVSSFGLWGVTAASQTSAYTGGLQQSTGAFGGYLVNDYAGTGNLVGRVNYAEVQHSSSNASAASWIMESVVKNTGGTNYSATPYGGSRFGPSGIPFGCGGDPSYGGTANANCNYTLLIQQSTGATVKWNKGFVFDKASLNGADGTNTGGNTAEWVETGYGQGWGLYSSNGSVLSGRITSIGTSSADQRIEQQFGNSLLNFSGVDSGTTVDTALGMTHVATAINGVRVTDAVSGSGPIVAAITSGSDTNINLNLIPLGTGQVVGNGGGFLSAQYTESGAIGAAFGTGGVGLSVVAQTQTDSTTAAGTVTSAYFHNIAAPTFATSGNAITVTNAYTVDISGCPLAGANVTISTCGGLRVGGGQAQFNGLISGGAGATIGGGTINLNTSASTNVVNIGTGSTTGQVAIGGGSDAVVINSSASGSVKEPALISNGTKFTTSGCSISSTTGGAAAGTFTLGANTCTAVVTINGATGLTATNGWSCQAHDRTAPTVLIGGESSSTTTTASFTIPAGAGATDVIAFSCMGY